MSFFKKAQNAMEGIGQNGCEKSEISEIRILSTSPHETGLEMSLSDFEKAGLVLKVYSEVLREHVYFVSSDTCIKQTLDAVAYISQELEAMLDMTPEEVKAAHEVKKAFHKARVIEHRKAVNG